MNTDASGRFQKFTNFQLPQFTNEQIEEFKNLECAIDGRKDDDKETDIVGRSLGKIADEISFLFAELLDDMSKVRESFVFNGFIETNPFFKVFCPNVPPLNFDEGRYDRNVFDNPMCSDSETLTTDGDDSNEDIT
eukprot:UN29904